SSILLNGAISANGVSGNVYQVSGSGGGLHIEAVVLAGAGQIKVGGSASPYGDPGAGGRLSLVVADSSGFIGTRSAVSGVRSTLASGAGTLFERHPDNAYGHLVVANDGTYSGAGR